MIVVWNVLKGLMAFATFGLVIEQSVKNSVLCATLCAFDDYGFWLQNGLAFAAKGVIFQSFFWDSILGPAA
jgi:hypothetical protein